MSKLLKAVVLGLMVLAPATARAAPSKCVLQMAAELPVTMRGLRPMVTAQVNGVDVDFIADSGAFYSSITTATATALKLPGSYLSGVTVRGVNGSTQASVATVKTFGLAGMVLPRREFLVLPSIGGDTGGLLGQNILGVTDLEYDLAHGAIRFVLPKDCGPKSVQAYWAADGKYSTLDIRVSTPAEPHMIGTIQINGVQLRALFDTGAPVSTMTLEAAKRLGITPESAGVRAVGQTGGLGSRSLRSWITPIAKLDIGGEVITSTRMRFFDGHFNADLLIGADFFLSHRVYVSKEQHRLYFTYTGGPVFDLTSPASASLSQAQAEAAPVASGELADADAYSRRGAFAETRRDYKSALADFDKAVELKPDEPDYLFRRALVHGAMREPAKARADLDKAIAFSPNHIDSLVARATFLVGQDKAAAKADMDAAAKAAPKDADVRMRLAHLYSAIDLNDLAVAELDLWLASHSQSPERSEAQNNRCWSLALLGRSLESALADCNRAIATRKEPSRLDSRGLVQLRLGAYDKAIADYDEALKGRPNMEWSLYGRGLAKLAKGMKTEGEADLAAAAKLSPGLAARAKSFGIGPEMLAAKP